MERTDQGEWVAPDSRFVQILEVRFIRIGYKVIRLDQIFAVGGLDPAESTVYIYSSGGQQEAFVGAEAAALRAFFLENTVDVVNVVGSSWGYGDAGWRAKAAE